MLIMEIVFALVVYAAPVIILPFIVRRRASVRRIALLVFFVAPLIGEVTYLLWLSEQGFRAISTLSFWKTIIGFYPMAVFPLGLWAAFLGAGGTRVLEAIALRYGLGLPSILFVGLLFGAIIGPIFMSVFTLTAILTGTSSQLNEGLLPYALAGLMAGGVSGAASAYFASKGSISTATNPR